MKNEQQTLVILTPAFPANESETSWVTTQQLFVKALKDHFPELPCYCPCLSTILIRSSPTHGMDCQLKVSMERKSEK